MKPATAEGYGNICGKIVQKEVMTVEPVDEQNRFRVAVASAGIANASRTLFI